MERPRRIIGISHLAHPDEVTGAERSLVSVLSGLRDRGHDVEIVAPGDGRSVADARALGIPVDIIGWPRLWWSSWHAAPLATTWRAARFVLASRQLIDLSRRLEQRRPAVVLCNTLVNVGAAWAAHRAGLPVVWRVAEIPGQGLRRQLFRWASRRFATRVVCVSQAVADALDVANSCVIHSGVEIPAEDVVVRARAELRTTLGVGEDALVIGHAGQLRPHKGQLEMVRAACAIASDLPHASFAVLGSVSDATYAAGVRAAGEELGDRLQLPGFVAGGPAGLDVLVFTSIAPDPFPRVILEAMAAGVAVVAFAGGGVAEAVVDGETGCVAPVGDVESLARALRDLGTDADRRRRYGVAARERARALFPADAVAGRYKAVLEQARR